MIQLVVYIYTYCVCMFSGGWGANLKSKVVVFKVLLFSNFCWQIHICQLRGESVELNAGCYIGEKNDMTHTCKLVLHHDGLKNLIKLTKKCSTLLPWRCFS